jgi:hypothetical protein
MLSALHFGYLREVTSNEVGRRHVPSKSLTIEQILRMRLAPVAADANRGHSV